MRPGGTLGGPARSHLEAVVDEGAASMAQHVVHTQLPGQLVMLGCGSIAQAVLPLILRHLGVTPDRITIVPADARGRDEAAHYGIGFHETALTQDNYRHVLEPLVGAGDFLVNLSV